MFRMRRRYGFAMGWSSLLWRPSFIGLFSTIVMMVLCIVSTQGAQAATLTLVGPIDNVFYGDTSIAWQAKVSSPDAGQWRDPTLYFSVTLWGSDMPVVQGSAPLRVDTAGVGTAELALQATDLPASERIVWYQLHVRLETAAGEVLLTNPATEGSVPLRAFGVIPRTEETALSDGVEAASLHPDRKVMAFYYTWYGHPGLSESWYHWPEGGHDPEHFDAQGLADIGATHHPALGTYDSFDPDVIERHLQWAEAADIDVLIATWWGQGGFTDRVLEPLLDAAAKTNVRVAFYYESVPNSNPARAADDFLYLLDRYGDHPGVFQHEGSPVIFVYSRAIHQLTYKQWENVLEEVKAERPAQIIADTADSDWAAVFDGLHMYNPVPQVVAGVDMSQVYEALVQAADAHGKIAAVTVLPGYDDSNIGRAYPIVAPREDGRLYDRLWAMAIQSRPDWVLVTSFNEWHEGSDIEPSVEHGYTYLEATAYWAEQFRTASERTFRLGRLGFPAVISPGAIGVFGFEVLAEDAGEDMVVIWNLPTDWEVILLQPEGAPAGARELAGALTLPATASTGSHVVGAELRLGDYSQTFEVRVGVAEPGRAPFDDGSGAWVELGDENKAFGLAQREAADGLTEAVNLDGVEGRRTIPGVSNEKYMYFDVGDSFLYDIEARTIEIGIEYWDEGTHTVQVQYDSHNLAAPLDGAYAGGSTFRLTDTGTWKQTTLRLADARLANRQNEGTDFRLAVGTGVLAVRRVWVRLLD